MKLKNRLHRYDININRRRSRYEPKYSKYITYPTMMILIFIKQHLSNIWNSIHDKVKKH